jgi:hypothetical protein
VLRRKTIQVDSPRQTNSDVFYNTVSHLQQPKVKSLNPHGSLPPENV